jgi:crotonobetainyl-CoA:carnitine CoA-transferase CaiB-like acyl-CoA transferase
MWEGAGRVAVVGVGFSALTRQAQGTLGARTIEAVRHATADAGLDVAAIDGLAGFPEAPFRGAGNTDGIDMVTAEYLLRHLKGAAEVQWYAQIELGMVLSAVAEAANALLAGACRYALVWRALHQPGGTYGAVRTRYAAGETQFLTPYGFGSSFQPHALAYQRYLSRHGATRTAMAALVVSQRANANRNPRAYFRDQSLSVEDYLNARMIAEPLCLFDCDIPVEGAAAVILTTAERARDLRQPPAYLRAYGQNTARLPAVTPYTMTGLRVIDVSQGVPGPLCAMVLGDLGAEVIKVEPPAGDWLRGVGPFVAGESAPFVQINRNKRGITLDLKDPQGRAAFLRLVAEADVVIEGYRPEVMPRLGLGYAALAVANPSVVLCSISGYGSDGPLADQPASELDVQAFVGKNRQLGVAGEPPLRVGFDLISTNAAWAAAQGVVAALYARSATGAGQHVQTSLLDAAVAIMQWTTGAESDPDEWVGRPLRGYAEPPDHGYLSRDMPFLMDLGRGDDEFRRLCDILGLPEMAADPRFCGFRERAFNEGALKEALNPALSQWSFADLRDLVQNALGGTIVPMHDLATLSREPQVAALDIMHPVPHPVSGEATALNVPWRFSEPIARLGQRPAPRLGQHNPELLGG